MDGGIKQGIFRSFIIGMSGVCIVVTLDDLRVVLFCWSHLDEADKHEKK